MSGAPLTFRFSAAGVQAVSYIPPPHRRGWLAGALLLSLASHGAVILGIALRPPAPPPPVPPMVVTFLPNTPTRAAAPEDSEFFSDANRKAGASQEEKTGLPLPASAPPPLVEIPPQPVPPPALALNPPRQATGHPVLTAKATPKKIQPEPARPLEPVKPVPPRPLDLTPSLDDITHWDRRNQGDTLRQQSSGGEATVNINTRELRYASYMNGVKNLVESVWRYPAQAKRERITGTLLMRFSIDRDGNLAGVEILRSSGEPMLDHAAIEAVRKSAPYAPLPESWGVTRLHIHATFEYLLRNFRWAK